MRDSALFKNRALSLIVLHLMEEKVPREKVPREKVPGT